MAPAVGPGRTLRGLEPFPNGSGWAEERPARGPDSEDEGQDGKDNSSPGAAAPDTAAQTDPQGGHEPARNGAWNSWGLPWDKADIHPVRPSVLTLSIPR